MIRTFIVAASIGALNACGHSTQHEIAQREFPPVDVDHIRWPNDTGLSLIAFAMGGAEATSDSPLVAVILHNGGLPRFISNLPSFDHITIFDSVGREVPQSTENYDDSLRLRINYEAPLLGDTTRLVLPYQGFIGNIFNLRCAVPPFDQVRQVDHCMWRYNPPPGEY